jgi:hypothetical protein
VQRTIVEPKPRTEIPHWQQKPVAKTVSKTARNRVGMRVKIASEFASERVLNELKTVAQSYPKLSRIFDLQICSRCLILLVI